jgi:hypothetical protein
VEANGEDGGSGRTKVAMYATSLYVWADE